MTPRLYPRFFNTSGQCALGVALGQFAVAKMQGFAITALCSWQTNAMLRQNLRQSDTGLPVWRAARACCKNWIQNVQ